MQISQDDRLDRARRRIALTSPEGYNDFRFGLNSTAWPIASPCQRRMTRLQQCGSDQGQKIDVLRVKRPISERKLLANRANAKPSTGPRTEAGRKSDLDRKDDADKHSPWCSDLQWL